MAEYEVIVVGCGPAGLSAAIYVGRAKIKTLVVGKKENSQLVKAHNIENYFGFSKGITGAKLLEEGITQTKRFGVEIHDGEVVDIEQDTKKENGFMVKLGTGETHTAQALIIATGTPIKLSGIENEEKFTGKGVHYCVECDGSFYDKKKVVLIGNGNHAADDALDMKVFTNDVSIISNADKFTFSAQMKKNIAAKNIPLITNKIKAFEGKDKVEKIVFEDGSDMAVDGAFMACGTASALDFSNNIGLTIDKNILIVDADNKTNIDGIFAAGNCCARCRQVAKNVGDGCNAGLSAIKYLRHKDLYFDYSSSNK